MTIEQFKKAEDILDKIKELKRELRDWELESNLLKQIEKEYGSESYLIPYIEIHHSRVSVEKSIFIELVNKMISHLNDKISSLETELEKL